MKYYRVIDGKLMIRPTLEGEPRPLGCFVSPIQALVTAKKINSTDLKNLVRFINTKMEHMEILKTQIKSIDSELGLIENNSHPLVEPELKMDIPESVKPVRVAFQSRRRTTTWPRFPLDIEWTARAN